MDEVTSKRRKMRPNNPITKEKLTKIKSESSNEKKLAERALRKAEKSQRKAEKKAKRKAEKKARRAEEKKKKSLKSKGEFKEIETSSSILIPNTYQSDSDSDETDKEEQITKNTKQISLSNNATYTAMEVDTPMAVDTPMEESNVDNVPLKSEKVMNDLKLNSEKKDIQKKLNKKQNQISKDQSTNENNDGNYKTKEYISESDSDSSSDENTQNPLEFEIKKKLNPEHLKANRISFRQKKEYDSNLTAAENIRGRLNDLFVPSVKEDDFISESDSEPDSGEDYETKEYPSWQRTLSLKHNQETDPWPKHRKFGYSDKLKLEKRIKKICKRENISFAEVREIFSSSKRGPYIRLFQKIAKVFPTMSLHALARQCKVMYHTKRVSTPWTEEEIARLKELVKIYGSSPTKLSEHLDRSPKNISDFMYNHLSTGKKNIKRWTPEEDLIIAKAASKLKPKETLPASSLVTLFNETRTPKQIHRRYQAIRHLIQEDGTVVQKRKATLNEELEYLKRLLQQAKELDLQEESQLDYAKDRGFVAPSFYLKSRCTINGFEKMDIKEILQKLIKRQERIIESRRLEQILDQK